MSRTTVPLAGEHLDAFVAGAPCGTCLFWELDPVRRRRDGDRAAQKRSWVEAVLREWGTCGRVALVDDEPVGWLLYAPAAFVPGANGFPTAPVSADAVLLTTAYVGPRHAGGGLGRMLVQAMAADLVERGGVGAVEAFGDTRGAGHCVVPAEFLGAVGFHVQRAHPTTPRLRMELKATLTWRDEVGAVLDRLRGAVRAPASDPTSARTAARVPARTTTRPPSPTATRVSRTVPAGPGWLSR